MRLFGEGAEARPVRLGGVVTETRLLSFLAGVLTEARLNASANRSHRGTIDVSGMRSHRDTIDAFVTSCHKGRTKSRSAVATGRACVL